MRLQIHVSSTHTCQEHETCCFPVDSDLPPYCTESSVCEY